MGSVDHSGIELEEADGAIAMAGGALGAVYRVVDLHRPAA